MDKLKAASIALFVVWMVFISVMVIQLYDIQETIRKNRTASPAQVQTMSSNTERITRLEGQVQSIDEFGTGLLQQFMDGHQTSDTSRPSQK